MLKIGTARPQLVYFILAFPNNAFVLWGPSINTFIFQTVNYKLVDMGIVGESQFHGNTFVEYQS